MKLTLKRDLPLLLAALLVIWGLWYARPIGVDTLYPELEPDIIEVYLSDFTTYRHEDRRLKLTPGQRNLTISGRRFRNCGSGAPPSTWWCRPSPSWKGSWTPTSNTRKPMI